MTAQVTLVAVLTSPSERRCLRRLAGALGMRLRWCASVAQVEEAMQRRAPVALLAPACDADGRPSAPTLRRIRRIAPSLGIVVLVRRDCPSSMALAAFRLADHALFAHDLRPTSLWVAVNAAIARRR